MSIKQIVVHPKGATHIDNLKYFLKKVDGVWMFYCPFVKSWIRECFAAARVKPIHTLH